jgi:hypothetical protein
LARYYGERLSDLLRGSWRRLWVLVAQLPPDSALGRAQSGGWTTSEHLLALAVDVLQSANWQRQGDNHAPRPQPISRPGVAAPASPQERFEARARAFLARHDGEEST